MGKIIEIEKEAGVPFDELLRKLYIGEKLGCKKIANQLNIHAMTVHKYLVRFGIERREKIEAVKATNRSGPNNSMYGKKHSEQYKEEQSRRLKAAIQLRGKHWAKGRIMPDDEKMLHSCPGDKNGRWKGGRRIQVNGYIEVYTGEGSPNSRRNTSYEHRIAAENKIGRKLYPGEVVHHIDGDKQNNSPDNLLVLSNKDHVKLHSTENIPRMNAIRKEVIANAER